MTIDEAIYCLKAESERYSEVCEECTLYRKVGCDHCYNDTTDVAIKELEELKEYKLKEFQCHLAREEGVTIGYEKCIDDFVKKLDKHQKENWIDNLEYGITWNDIEQVAEQLKEGGNNGNSTTDN